jgi:hypothetical protein
MHSVLVSVGLVLGASASVVGGQGVVPTPPLAAVAAVKPSSPLDALRFLVGTWDGDGAGQPGRGTGATSFRLDLDGRVLVRRSHSVYPAAGGRPAVVHDDLMVIYAAPGGGGLGATYFDNEGHVIEYAAEVSPDGRRVVFLSEAEPAMPTFRLTYARVAEDLVDVTFEIAPPGSPNRFTPYVSGRVRRTTH